MIKALRKKFVATNMALVSLVLLVVFGVLLITTANNARADTLSALRMAVELQNGGPKPFISMNRPDMGETSDAQLTPSGTEDAADGMVRRDGKFSHLPVFWVLLTENGTLTESDTSAVDIADDTLNAVAAAAYAAFAATERESGTLRDPALRYLVQRTPEGLRIAFADRSYEAAAVQRLALQSALIGLLALAAFFGISVFLAHLALKPVEKTWQQQRQFVADASHELKTPLTVILANAGILTKHPNATVAEERKWVDGIADEAERMKQLVEDLLFLARADALRTPMMTGLVDLSSAVESAALAFESVAFERGVTVHSEVAEGMEVSGDGKQLAQLVQILLDNACKYAGTGGAVEVSLQPVQNSAVCKVTNTGDTLSPEEISHLFERFYRTDAARTRGGYGLGLAIAQSIVEAHRGSIQAESREGRTTFTVTLPTAKERG